MKTIRELAPDAILRLSHWIANYGKEKQRPFIDDLTVVLAMAQKTVPSWHDRPTCPGKWICTPDKEHASSVPCLTVLDLTSEDLERGAPFATGRVYGPIPNDEVAE